MRIPANKIIENQSTSGGEYMVKSSQQEYQGQYYILGNSYYASAKFDPNAAELVKLSTSDSNVLLNQASTFEYGQLNTNSSLTNLLSIPIIQNIKYQATSNDVTNGYIVRYFCQQLNVIPLLIKEIDETTYNLLLNNSIYLVISLNYYLLTHDTTDGNFKPEDLANANAKMVGLNTFLSSQ